MWRIARTLTVIALIIGLGYWMYSSGWNYVSSKVAGTSKEDVASTAQQVKDKVEDALDLEWNVGEILDVEVEEFKVQALVVDNHNGFFLVDSADLDLWYCEDMSLLSCEPTIVNCSEYETFASLQKKPDNYLRCMKG